MMRKRWYPLSAVLCGLFFQSTTHCRINRKVKGPWEWCNYRIKWQGALRVEAEL